MSDIVTRTKLDASGLKTGLSQAKGYVQGFKNDVAKQFTGAIAFGGIMAGANALIERFSRVADLSKRLTTPAESIQRIGHAATQSGADIELAVRALGQLTIKAREASVAGGDQAAAWQKLGIDAGEFVAMSPEQKLLALSRAHAAAAGDAGLQADLMALLGNRMGDLITLLAEGEEGLRKMFAEAPVAGQKTIAAIDALGDRIDALKGTMAVWGAEAIGWIDKVAGAFGTLSTGEVKRFGSDMAGLTGMKAVAEFISDQRDKYNLKYMTDAQREQVEGSSEIERKNQELADKMNRAAQLPPGVEKKTLEQAIAEGKAAAEAAAAQSSIMFGPGTDTGAAAFKLWKEQQKQLAAEKYFGPGNDAGETEWVKRQWEEQDRRAKEREDAAKAERAAEERLRDAKFATLDTEQQIAELMARKAETQAAAAAAAGSERTALQAQSQEIANQIDLLQKRRSQESQAQMAALAQNGPGRASGTAAIARRASELYGEADELEAAGYTNRATSRRDRADRLAAQAKARVAARDAAPAKTAAEAIRDQMFGGAADPAKARSDAAGARPELGGKDGVEGLLNGIKSVLESRLPAKTA